MAGAFEYNFRESPAWSPPEDVRRPFDARAATTGTDWAAYMRECPGMSAFAVEPGVVYQTYSAYARGLNGLWGMYQWLNRAPRGRNEARGPDDLLNGFGRHDEYPPRKRGQQIIGPGWHGPAVYNHPDHPVRARPRPPL